MGVFDWFKNLFRGDQKLNRVSVDMPLWQSSYGENIYQNDIVKACIHAIAEEVSKMIIKSIRITEDGVVSKNRDAITKLFKHRPNPLMTARDLLYWTAVQTEIYGNAYWMFDTVTRTYSNGQVVKEIIAIYPVDTLAQEMFISPETGETYIRFNMRTGGSYVVKYSEIFHIRKHYGTDYFFGKPDRNSLLKFLKTESDINDLIPKAVNASMSIKGILSAKSLSDQASLKKFKEEFEQSIQTGKTGFGVLDVGGDFKPVSITPTVVPADVLLYLENKVLKAFGVDMSILLGNATEQVWSSFYSKNIEGYKINIEQGLTNIVFSPGEVNHGNEIRVYDKLVQHYTINTRLNIIKELGSRGYLSRSEQRELAGYEPDGGAEKVSLNFVDKDKANEYQLGKEDNEDEEHKEPRED